MIKIRLFASLSEKLGRSTINFIYSGESTVDEVKQHLLESDERWTLLNEQQVQVAVNQTLSQFDAKINDGDEIAFFPPVTGG